MATTDVIPGYNYFTSIPALKAAARNAGSHFFDKGAMQFFNSRIEGGMIGGRWFITSEQFDDESPRLYTVRVVTRDDAAVPALQIDTVGEFQAYTTKAEARASALAAQTEGQR